jgi:MFS family permease
VFGSFNPMLVVFAREVFYLGPEAFGFLQSAAGLGTVLGSLTLTAFGDVKRKGRLLLLAAVSYGVTVVAFALTPWFLLAAAILLASGAADIVNGATRMTVIQLLVPGHLRGRVMGLHAVSTRGLGPLGGFNLGTMASFMGVQYAVALGGAVCILAGTVVAWRVPAIRRFSGDEPSDTPALEPRKREGARDTAEARGVG